MKKLEFAKKNKNYFRIKEDCTVKSYGEGKTLRSYVGFRNETAPLICKTGYVTFAIYENRLYFKEENNGFKLTKHRNISKFETRHKALANFIKDKQGNYNLKFDEEVGLYYIELT